MKQALLSFAIGLLLGLGLATLTVVYLERDGRTLPDALVAAVFEDSAEVAGVEPVLEDSIPPSTPPLPVDTSEIVPDATPPRVVEMAMPLRPELRSGSTMDATRLAKLFASMQAREAARVMEHLENNEVRIILSELSNREAAAILGNLTPERAATISRSVIRGDNPVMREEGDIR